MEIITTVEFLIDKCSVDVATLLSETERGNKCSVDVVTLLPETERVNKCSVDVVKLLPETERGNKCVLISEDDLSRYAIAIPILQRDSTTIPSENMSQVNLKHWTPRTVLI
jgi:hypothetical protein